MKHPRGKPDLPSFKGALAKARRDPTAPQPLCLDRTAEFVDYVTLPTPEEAEELCSGCELLESHRASARRTKPAWGVHAGEVWDMGKIAS